MSELIGDRYESTEVDGGTSGGGDHRPGPAAASGRDGAARGADARGAAARDPDEAPAVWPDWLDTATYPSVSAGGPRYRTLLPHRRCSRSD